MYTTRNRRARIAGVAALALSGLMLSSCSQLPGGDGSEGSGENVGAAGSATSEMKEDFDTGEYETTFYVPFKEVTDPDTGEVTEGMELGRKVLLASEVDEDFDQVAWSAFETNRSLRLVDYVSFNEHADQFQSGYFVDNRAADNRVLNASVYRFDSPETAQAVQAARSDEIRNDDREYVDPFTDRPIDGLEDTVALVNHPKHVSGDNNWARDFKMTTFSTHNEFLIKVDLESPRELTDEDYAVVGDYLKAQAPLLDAVPTHRTEAGFGRLDNWPDADPDGVVRYAVVPPEGSKNDPSVPRSLNDRTFAGIHGLDYAKTSDAFRSAGVEGAGNWGATVVQARDEAAAESFRDFLDEQDAANEPTSYEEPQGVPNTTCSEHIDGTSEHTTKKIYSCVMVHGRHVAFSSTEEYLDGPGGAAVNRDDAADDEVDPKTLLSQRMAAQYEVFEDAEDNPDGTPRPQRTAVNSGEESTGESAPADGGDGSSEPAEPAGTPATREKTSEGAEESVINVY